MDNYDVILIEANIKKRNGEPSDDSDDLHLKNIDLDSIVM